MLPKIVMKPECDAGHRKSPEMSSVRVNDLQSFDLH